MSASSLSSPCISICQIDPGSDTCIGCYRTREEIAGWLSMTPEEQRVLIAALRTRRNEATGRAGRRTRRMMRQAGGG